MLLCMCLSYFFLFFFFNDTATTEIYTLSLHDALPIYDAAPHDAVRYKMVSKRKGASMRINHTNYFQQNDRDRKSTRLNSSHLVISYAVFCLKKKKIQR